MASPQAAGKPANGSTEKKADGTSAEAKKITATAYVIAVLKSRESQKPREKKLLERVIPEERAKAEALLEKLGG